MPKYTFHSGPPISDGGNRIIRWLGIRSDLLRRAAAQPGTWMLVERSAKDKSRYAPHRLATNPAFNGIRVNEFHRKALPQKNESRKIQRWEIWLRIDPDWYAQEQVKLNEGAIRSAQTTTKGGTQ